MFRYAVVASVAFAVGILAGIGIAELNSSQIVADAKETAADLKDAQDLLRGAEINLEAARNREVATRKELIAARVKLAGGGSGENLPASEVAQLKQEIAAIRREQDRHKRVLNGLVGGVQIQEQVDRYGESARPVRSPSTSDNLQRVLEAE